jgi:hypothetical protein
MKRTLQRAALALAVLAAAVYAADYLLLRFRIRESAQVFGTVTIYRYYAVEEKNHKTEYMSNGAADQTCVHSLFPHLGYAPCWYLSRHTEQRIAM